MKFVDEYRGAEEARQFVAAIERLVTRPWNLMEICGGQTHTPAPGGGSSPGCGTSSSPSSSISARYWKTCCASASSIREMAKPTCTTT